VLNILALPPLQNGNLEGILHQFGQLGVIWLMFAAGLEIELQDLRRAGGPALMGGLLGVAVPLLLGSGLSLIFGSSLSDAVFLGIVLSATSVSISAQTLLELGQLRSREGVALLGAAVIDDLLVIVALAVFVGLVGAGGTVIGLLAKIGLMLLTLLVVLLLSLYLLPRLAEWALALRVSEGLLAIVLATVLFLAWAMEYLGGVAAITGAFLAGVGLGRSHLREQIENGLHRLAFGFFVPLFLVDIGLQSNLRALSSDGWVFALLIILVAILSKALGAGAGARLGGFDRSAAFRMGLGMISRGEVGLIVAGVGIAEGVLPAEQFAMIVFMILATTLLTPPLLRWAYRIKEAPDA
jgi:Kef-type K+ transport system membrane component KefB